mgnify:CR=1 FL=1
MIGGDLPGWLGTLFRSRAIRSLTDQRGECIYAACPHYRKCFIERSARAGRKADIVIANHALVLHQAAVDHALGVAATSEEEAAPGGIRRDGTSRDPRRPAAVASLRCAACEGTSG